MLYLIWQDLTKTPTADKIAAGAARYLERFGEAPDVALTHTTEAAVEVAGLQVRGQINVRPGNYWLGIEEQASDAPPSRMA